MEFVDTHSHIDDRAFRNDRDEILASLNDKGLKFILTVGYDIESSENCVDIAKKYKNVYAVAGIHPHDAKLMDEASIQTLEQLSILNEVVAIGETGLDFYRLLSNKTQQYRAFRVHMNIALSANKPIVIHDREAHNEIINVLEEYRDKVIGVIHAFSGDKAMAKKVLDMGYYISICGWITYKKAQKTRDIIPYIPDDRILVETDSPYLSPVPHRGKRNQPAYVRFTLEKLAEIRNTSMENICEITTQNAERLFNI